MSLVTVLWSMIGATAFTLGAVHGLAWLLDRRNLPSLMFCVTAVAIACFAPFDLGMMHATTPAEYGEWLRWYYLPGFFFNVGCLLFVWTYLGTGRRWLAWTVICTRAFVVIANLLVHPNFAFRAILSLRKVSFLGEHVSVIGDAVVRSWQWLMPATMPLLLAFVIDATIQCWRRDGIESRRKALVVGVGIAGPLTIAWLMWQVGLLRFANIPALYTPLFAITLTAMAFELSRATAVSRQSQLEIAELRADLSRAGRVSALGQLASGLAHELNQPLGAILRNTEAAELHLQTREPDLEELRAILTDIREDDTRAAQIISRMRALIKRRNVEVRPLTLADLVRDVMSLVQSEALSRRVALDCSIEPGLPRVLCDRVQVSQVLLNLVMNGIEAVQSSPVNARYVTIEARAKGERVEVAVSDSGPGIPAERINQVFEPFFSTKSEGMGMGLTICRTIIEGHEGSIWAEHNAEGRGATFRFTLPRVRERPESPAVSSLPGVPRVSAAANRSTSDCH